MHEMRQRLSMLPAMAKVGLVVGGYVGALLLALFAVWLSATLADPIDSDASAGMQAFGDSVLFIAVLGVASMLPTGLALFFLHELRAR